MQVDQLGDVLAALHCLGLARRFLLLVLLLLVRGDEAAEIRDSQFRHFGLRRCGRLAGRLGVRTMPETLIEIGDHIRQKTVARRDTGFGLRRSRVLAGHGTNQIRAADNADDAAVLGAHHRYPLDAVRDQQTRHLAEIGILADGDCRRRHHVARPFVGSAQVSEKLRAERLALGEHGQPPVAARLACGLVTADQVALADHAECGAAVVEDRDGAYPVLAQRPGDRTDGGIGIHRHDGRRHHVARLHRIVSCRIGIYRRGSGIGRPPLGKSASRRTSSEPRPSGYFQIRYYRTDSRPPRIDSCQLLKPVFGTGASRCGRSPALSQPLKASIAGRRAVRSVARHRVAFAG